MIIKYDLDRASVRLVLDETIQEEAATYNVSIKLRGLPSSMFDKFHAGIRKTLFQYGWDGSIGATKGHTKKRSKKAQPQTS